MSRRKTLIGIVLGLIVIACGGAAAVYYGLFYATFTPNCVGVAATDTAAFNGQISLIGVSRTGTIKVPWNSTRCVLNNITIPSNITLDFASNSTGVQITTGQTLTINGPYSAPAGQQVFFNALSGQGTVSFVGNTSRTPLYPQWWQATPIATGIQAAVTAAGSAGGGRVILAAGQTYELGATGLVIASDYVTIEGETNVVFVRYSGTGIVFDAWGSQYIQLKNIYLLTSDDAATGVRFGNASRWCRLENFTHQGNSASSNTGTGIDLDGTGTNNFFSGYLYMEQVYSLGNKYGIRVHGSSTTHTWTSIWGNGVSLVGRAAGKVTGSIGLWTDDKTNGEGSFIRGLIIEHFATGVQFDTCGTCFGFGHLSGGLEDNTVTLSAPDNWNGEFSNIHGDGFYQRSTSNQLNNLWDREKRLAGVWTTESLGDRIHVIYDGSTLPQTFGFRRGGSEIGGGYAADKFVVGSGGAASTDIDLNYFKFLEYKQSWAATSPDRGSWQQGSIVWNTALGLGKPIGWFATDSGTLNKTMTSLTTAATSSASPDIIFNHGTNVSVNDYITIVGVSGTKRVKIITDSTHITLDSNAGATVAAGAVAYGTAVFVAGPSLNDPGIARIVNPFAVTSSTTLADVPDLHLMVTTGVAYSFEAYLPTTSNVAGGVKVAVACTCTATSITYDAIVHDGSTSFTSRATGLATAAGGITAVTAAVVEVRGTIAVNAGGIFKVQFAQNASSGSASTALVNGTFATKPIQPQ